MKKIMMIRNPDQLEWVNNGIGTIGTILHNSGDYKVKIIDNNAKHKTNIIKVIKKFHPDFLMYSISIYNALITYRQVKKIKRIFPNLIIIGGGIHIKNCYKEALENNIDIVVNIEGEKVILPLLNHLKKNLSKNKNYKDNLELIKGISFKKENGEFYFAKEFPILENLDEVPIVNYDLYNLEDFQEPYFFITGSRGCPFGCKFCSTELQRKDKRIASAEWLFRNVEDLYKKYQIKKLFIGDNNLTIFPERVIEFCNLMISSGLNERISLTFQTTIRFPIKEELIILMKKAGFDEALFGVERFTDYSLKMINKEQSIKNAIDIFKIFKKNNIKVSIWLMAGFPFETKEILKEEKKSLLNIKDYIDEIHFSILFPIPSTIYYEDYPKSKEWYFDWLIHFMRNSRILSHFDFLMRYELSKNFFNLSKQTRKAIVDYYIFLKKLNKSLLFKHITLKLCK